MSELEVDETTATFVRAQARAAGLSEAEWLARHFGELSLAESADQHARWYADHPDQLEAEVREAQAANAEADAA